MAGVVIMFLLLCAVVVTWADHRLGAERRIVARERRARWEDTRV